MPTHVPGPQGNSLRQSVFSCFSNALNAGKDGCSTAMFLVPFRNGYFFFIFSIKFGCQQTTPF